MKQLVLLSLAWCVLLKCCGYCSSVELQQLKQQTDPEQTPTSSGGGGGLSVGDVAAIASTIGVIVAAIVGIFIITGVIVGIWKNCKEQENNGAQRNIGFDSASQHSIAAADNHSDGMALQPMSNTVMEDTQQQQGEQPADEQQVTQQQASSSVQGLASPPAPNDEIDSSSLADCLHAIRDLNDWEQLGLNLGLKKKPTLDKIALQCRDKIDQCKREMLQAWFNWQDNVDMEKYGRPSWKRLVDAIPIDDKEIAEDIVKSEPWKKK